MILNIYLKLRNSTTQLSLNKQVIATCCNKAIFVLVSLNVKNLILFSLNQVSLHVVCSIWMLPSKSNPNDKVNKCIDTFFSC